MGEKKGFGFGTKLSNIVLTIGVMCAVTTIYG